MTTLYLARHGQTEENLKRIFQGHLPGILTEEGKRQAAELGEALEEIELDAVVNSDLQRVVDTVRIALGERRLPWETTPLLREIDWGSWTGLYLSAVDRNDPPADVETWEMLYRRAGKFLDYIRRNYDGKRVLAVGHGQINRAVQAWLEQIPAEGMNVIPLMRNGEVREFALD